ncbi:phosphate ABC transporter permease [Janibacter melonis]|uniref:Transport permease protein n=1 Tax=Janibacter melonis TaxID=262209 RepID=A0A176QF99_9MICO|nr:ABC transporter permease [Janibacter melonis]OAB88389.1 phosphate ABC transporter permease [Janibacter melonis]
MTEGPSRAPSAPVQSLSPSQAQALAERYGLTRLGTRPPLGRYVRDLWRRRSFLWTLSSAQSYARNHDNRLGQLWQLLNPALLIGSYFLIFGVLLGTTGSVSNRVGFLSIGVILFAYTSSVITRGAKSITSNLGLVRGLRFPRAVLPLSVTLTELIAATPAFGLLLVVMLVTGETPSLRWLLLPVAILLQTGILAGLAFIGARVVNASKDLGQLIPVVVRLLRYTSGVFFPVAQYAERLPGIWGDVLVYQPFALPLEAARQSLMSSQDHPFDLTTWWALAAWSIALLAIGLVIFWRDEAKYGRG